MNVLAAFLYTLMIVIVLCSNVLIMLVGEAPPQTMNFILFVGLHNNEIVVFLFAFWFSNIMFL